MKNPNSLFFSIILATYNGNKYLQQQLDSIIEQNFSSWEIIIIDDCSKDDTLKIVMKFKNNNKNKKIQIFKNSKNLGPSSSFINNLKFANGKWIIFCDQDDIWFENKLESLYYKIKADSKITAFLHNARYLIDKNQNIIYGISKKKISNNELVYKKPPNLNLLNLLLRNRVVGCFSAFKKDILLERLILKPPKFVFYDHWISLIILFDKKIFYIKEPLMLYRRHSETYTLRNFNSLTLRFLQRIILLIYLIFNLFLFSMKIIKNNWLKKI